MATSTKRSRQIKITVTPELHAKLLMLAEAYGQPPATLASVLLGQVVATQINGLQVGQRMSDAFASQVGDSLKESLRELAK
jgi:hypothetical protein